MSNIKDILCSKCGEWSAHCDCEPHLKPFTFVSPSPRAIRMAEAYEPQELAEALLQREEELKEALEERKHLLAVCAEYRDGDGQLLQKKQQLLLDLERVKSFLLDYMQMEARFRRENDAASYSLYCTYLEAVNPSRLYSLLRDVGNLIKKEEQETERLSAQIDDIANECGCYEKVGNRHSHGRCIFNYLRNINR